MRKLYHIIGREIATGSLKYGFKPMKCRFALFNTLLNKKIPFEILRRKSTNTIILSINMNEVKEEKE